ncbi:MAG: DUF6370 family protein [Ferruginibacter sp.]
MKTIFTFLCGCFFTVTAMSQNANTKVQTPDAKKALQVVEVSCGKCKLGMSGKSCDMAVRIGDKSYYVDGASIDNYGDAHADDGMCNAIRKAEVQGEIIDNRFNISYIKLLPLNKEKAK